MIIHWPGKRLSVNKQTILPTSIILSCGRFSTDDLDVVAIFDKQCVYYTGCSTQGVVLLI